MKPFNQDEPDMSMYTCILTRSPWSPLSPGIPVSPSSPCKTMTDYDAQNKLCVHKHEHVHVYEQTTDNFGIVNVPWVQ